jgi:hypothetical protein
MEQRLQMRWVAQRGEDMLSNARVVFGYVFAEDTASNHGDIASVHPGERNSKRCRFSGAGAVNAGGGLVSL